MSSTDAERSATPDAERPPELRWSAPFAELALGQRFQGASRTVEEADVIGFCALSGDWHPQHSDAAWAARSPFGERIAHGMLVLSLAVGLVPLDPSRVRALRRIGDAVFKRPLRLGEQMSVAGEIASLRPVDEGAGLVDLRLSIRNGEGALLCRASVQVLWIGDEGASAAQAGSSETASAAGAESGYWSDAVPALAEAGGFVPLPI